MDEFLGRWLETVQFACEVQSVISMRLMRLTEGGPQAAAEAHQMVVEKLEALADAEVAMLRSLYDGEDLAVATERAYAPVRRRVQANHDRLMKAKA